MGSDWSWPCGEREKRKYKVKVTNIQRKRIQNPVEQKQNFQQTSFQVVLSRSARLQRTIRNNTGSYYPSYIVSNPINHEQSIIFLQKFQAMKQFNPREGNYIITHFSFSGDELDQWCYFLQNDIFNSYEVGMNFLGASPDFSGGLHMCYFKYDQPPQVGTEFIVKSIGNKISIGSLKTQLNQDPRLKFKICLEYKKEFLIVLEHPYTEEPKQYKVVQIPKEEIQAPGLEMMLAEKLETLCKNNKYEFSGAVSGKGSLFLILSKQMAGNSFTFIRQELTSIPQYPSEKTIGFHPVLKDQGMIRAIQQFHRLYIERQKFLNQCQAQPYERGIRHIENFLEKMIAVMMSLSQTQTEIPFKEMAVMTRVVQGFLISKSPTLALIKLIEEYKDQPVPEPILERWIFYLKKGRNEQLMKQFREHPQFRGNQHIFNQISTCINQNIRVFGHTYGESNTDQFKRKFNKLNHETQMLYESFQLKSKSKPAMRQLLMPILEIINGNLEKVKQYCMLNWLEYMLLHFLYKDGFPAINDSLLTKITTQFELEFLQKIMLDFINSHNVHGAVQSCLEIFPVFFMSHLIQILVILGKLPNQIQLGSQLNYCQEYYYQTVIEYISLTELDFKIPCDYIVKNLLTASSSMQDLIEQAVLNRINQGNYEQVSQYLYNYDLHEIRLTYLKSVVKQKLKYDQLDQAICWSSASGNLQLIQHVSDKIIEKTVNLPLQQIQQLLINIHQEIRTNSIILTFLKKFVQFGQALQQHDYKQACQHLVDFFINSCSPQQFNWRILQMSQPLFHSKVQIGKKELLKIMSIHQSVVNKSRGSILPESTIQNYSKGMVRASVLSLLRWFNINKMGECASRPSLFELDRHMQDQISPNDEYFTSIEYFKVVEATLEFQKNIHVLQIKQQFFSKKRFQYQCKLESISQGSKPAPELVVQIQKGVNLCTGTCSFAMSRPFVQIKLKPSGLVYSTALSDPFKPKWFTCYQLNPINSTGVEISCYLQDKITSKRKVGQVSFSLKELADQMLREGWFELDEKKEETPSIRMRVQLVNDQELLLTNLINLCDQKILKIQKIIDEVFEMSYHSD